MLSWQTEEIPPRNYQCGYCSKEVASNQGLLGSALNQKMIIGSIYICPGCGCPTFFDLKGNIQTPSPLLGNEVKSLPSEIEAIYKEARECSKVEAYTASVLLCRKLLMHIGVQEGAKPGDTFLSYVEYLAKQGYVSPRGKPWVDHIRKKGNEANHEIKLMSKDDAMDLLSFSEMLLKTIYEFPARIAPDAQNPSSPISTPRAAQGAGQHPVK
jgi:hypothetical protein